MSYINQPPDLRQIFDDLDQRLKKIETAQRFTSPAVATDPVNYRNGDIWLNTGSQALKTIINGVPQTVAFLEDSNSWAGTQTIPVLVVTGGATISGGSTIATGNLTVSTGSVSAGTSLAAGTTVTAGTGVTATTGGVTAAAGDITATTGNITSTAGTVTGVNLTSTGTTTVGAVNFATTTTATTVGAAGGATALPATPKGYLIISVAGTNYKIPYYNV
jgi:hypothetical protein